MHNNNQIKSPRNFTCSKKSIFITLGEAGPIHCRIHLYPSKGFLFSIWFSTLEKPMRHSKWRIPVPRSRRMNCQGLSLYMLACGRSGISKNTYIYFHSSRRDLFPVIMQIAGVTTTPTSTQSSYLEGAINQKSIAATRQLPKKQEKAVAYAEVQFHQQQPLDIDREEITLQK